MSAREECFVPSPFCIPMPDEDDLPELALPGTMIEQHLSPRLKRHRPMYRIPPPANEGVWKIVLGVQEGYRLLVHRCYVTLTHSVIVHDYIHVRCQDAIGGWIQKYVGYYDSESTVYPYDEYVCESVEECRAPVSPSVPSATILRGCSEPYAPPLHPRILKRPLGARLK